MQILRMRIFEKVKEKEISFPLVSKLNAKMRVRLKNGDPISYTVIEVKVTNNAFCPLVDKNSVVN